MQLVDMALMPPASNQYHHHHHHGYSQHNHSITSSVIPAIAAAQTTTTTATTTTAARRGSMDSPAAPVGSGGGSGNQQTTESSQPQQPQPALKCPRCDSSNTKFCYYNNYSLSQPRHFCKACKRYWTRGGTLRNVPVGGGCRKNKRIKKPATATSSGNKPAPSSSDGSSSHPSQPISSLSLPNTSSQIDASADIAPLLYALSNASASDLGLSSSFRQKLQQQGLPSCTAYDLHPQLSALGLSFPLNPNAQQQGDEDVRYQSGFKTHHLPQFQSQESSAAAATSAPPSLLHDSPFLNSSFSSASAASLLAATLRQPTTTTTTKISPSGWSPYGDLQQAVALTGTENFGGLKGIKEEQGNVGMCHSSGNRMEWQHVPFNENYALDIAAIGGADSSMYWNSSAMGGGVAGGWADATNC